MGQITTLWTLVKISQCINSLTFLFPPAGVGEGVADIALSLILSKKVCPDYVCPDFVCPDLVESPVDTQNDSFKTQILDIKQVVNAFRVLQDTTDQFKVGTLNRSYRTDIRIPALLASYFM